MGGRAHVALDEADVAKTEELGALPGDVERMAVEVDPDDGAVPADELGGEEGHVADAAADVKDAHAGLEARLTQQPFGHRLEQRRLPR